VTVTVKGEWKQIGEGVVTNHCKVPFQQVLERRRQSESKREREREREREQERERNKKPENLPGEMCHL
jgi:hypothetical protein